MQSPPVNIVSSTSNKKTLPSVSRYWWHDKDDWFCLFSLQITFDPALPTFTHFTKVFLLENKVRINWNFLDSTKLLKHGFWKEMNLKHVWKFLISIIRRYVFNGNIWYTLAAPQIDSDEDADDERWDNLCVQPICLKTTNWMGKCSSNVYFDRSRKSTLGLCDWWSDWISTRGK